MASRMFIRSMASAAETVIKAPKQLYGLDGTYATALYTAAAKESSIDKAAASLKSLQELVSLDKEISSILANPALSQDDRKVVVDTLKNLTPLDPTVSNLLNVLSENNRLSLFEDITKQFATLNDAHNGIVEATVTSSKPLDSKILKRLSTAIQGSEFVGTGKSLKIKNEVDPEILGGLVVEVSDHTIDLSIAQRIAKLNLVLKETI